MKILHRYTQAELFSDDSPTMKITLEKAVAKRADLGGAYLRGADLGGADLGGADLRGAYLRGADLGGADLGGADLRGADLRGADLRGADLGGADLGGADLRGADLSPAIIFNVSWGVVSDALCLEMMRFDAANHPDPKRFNRWAKDPSSGCPYTDVSITRMLQFQENPKLWKPGKAKSAYELMVLLFKEKGIKWGQPEVPEA